MARTTITTTTRIVSSLFIVAAFLFLYLALDGRVWLNTDEFEMPQPSRQSHDIGGVRPFAVEFEMERNSVDFITMRSKAQMDTKALYLSQQTKPPFDQAFKNPCWWHGKDNKTLACLPYFYLAGFPKSGTTDLYLRLIHHPLIHRGRMKEPHFLTRRRFGGRSYTKADADQYGHTSADVMRYATKYFKRAQHTILENASDTTYLSSFSGDPEFRMMFDYPAVTMDASASTVWDVSNTHHIIRDVPLAARVRRDPASVFDWIVRMNPEVRVLLILREPSSRVHSGYNYFRRGTTAEKFDACVDNFIRHYSECIQSGEQSPMICGRAAKKESKVRLHVGMYHLYIERLLARIPRDHIHILRTEDYSTNMAQNLRQVFHFLGIPQLTEMKLESICKLKQKNTARRKSEPMLLSTRRKLVHFYKPFNRKLARLLNDTSFLWQDVYSKYNL